MVNEIYAAIYARLDDQLTVPVFDHVPESEQGFPFVRLDAPELTENDVDDKPGYTATMTVIAYSRYRGSKEIADLAKEVYDALHRWAAPDTTSYSFSTIHQDFSSIVTESDGVTRMSLQRYILIFEPL